MRFGQEDYNAPTEDLEIFFFGLWREILKTDISECLAPGLVKNKRIADGFGKIFLSLTLFLRSISSISRMLSKKKGERYCPIKIAVI